jgi:hypothetical protein
VHVVLWFEGLEEAELLAIDDRIRPYLRWLQPRVHLLNSEICKWKASRSPVHPSAPRRRGRGAGGQGPRGAALLR